MNPQFAKPAARRSAKWITVASERPASQALARLDPGLRWDDGTCGAVDHDLTDVNPTKVGVQARLHTRNSGGSHAGTFHRILERTRSCSKRR